MGFFSADLEPMVELYQRESAELMEEFDRKQAEAMQKGSFSAQEIDAIFRVVHTIKSSAAMMGLADISDCTHRMEDLFLLFRNDRGRAVGKEDRIFDLMYTFSDFVEAENDCVTQEDFQPRSAHEVLDAIQKEVEFFSGAAAEQPAPAVAVEIAQPAPIQPKTDERVESAEEALGSNEIIWRVMLHPNCQMESVRAFMLVKQLEEYCTAITTEPANLELPGTAAEIAEHGLLLTLHTSQEEEAAQVLSSSPYVLHVETIGQHDDSSEAYVEIDDSQKESKEDAPTSRQGKFSMVSWDHVMRLQNITGDIITANTILGASVKRLAQDAEVENEFLTMKRLCSELEKLVADVSMMPVSSATPQYYRLVRDIAKKEGKQIRLKVVGEDLEVDRNLLDILANPLIHLLRNSSDHGIESPDARARAGKDPCGTITMRFENLADQLRVSVEDDGAGMDPQKLLGKAAERGLLTKDESQYSNDEILKFVFLPGFSTNEEVSSYSGRGVGMDVAQSVASNLGGSVTISSEPGKGTAVAMRVPVSVTSIECIRFPVGPYTCLVPIRSVVHIYSFEEVETCLQSVDGQTWFQAEELLPVLDLFDLYGLESKGEDRQLIVIKEAGNSAALLTGPVAGRQTAVEKPLPAVLGREYRTKTGMIGCTVTETGRIGMMLNADWLIGLCGRGRMEDEG